MISLRDEVTCLHCWTRFKPEEVLFVSEHRDLLGDPLLTENDQLRFLPSRFDIDGNAIDAKGQTCRELACPKCHLGLPRSVLEREPLFVSILGTPSCGKSYFLAALTTCLRRDLPGQFKLQFADADMMNNQILNGYEEKLFVNQNPQELVSLADLIPKTQLRGDLYRTVRYGQQSVTYPRPLAFHLEPLPGHVNHSKGGIERVICLYDNAGEHFLPGQDSSSAPGTRHLAESSFLMFLFDPTQDPRWWAALQELSPDMRIPRTQHAGRQEAVLREAEARVRKLLGITANRKHESPLMIVLNKCDLWRSAMLPGEWEAAIAATKHGVFGIHRKRLTDQSSRLRQLLMEHIPEIVYAAESFCREVFYLPASALGLAPQYQNGQAFIRPADIRPWHVTVPFLLGIALTTRGLVPIGT